MCREKVTNLHVCRLSKTCRPDDRDSYFHYAQGHWCPHSELSLGIRETHGPCFHAEKRHPLCILCNLEDRVCVMADRSSSINPFR